MRRFDLKILLNYLILLICVVVGFKSNGALYYILPVLQIFLSWLNCHYSNKWQMVLVLEIHLLIATVLGLLLAGRLYLKYVSSDAESMIVLQLVIISGVVFILILGIIATLFKYFSTKNGTQM